MHGRRGPGFWLLAGFFGLFVLFLYGPTITILVLSFQGPTGGLTFPMQGVSVHWFGNLFEKQMVGDFSGSFERSMALGVAAMLVTVIASFSAGLAFRTRFRGSALIFYLAIASLIVPSVLVSLGIGLLFRVLGWDPAWYTSAFGAHLTWTLPFGLLIMFAVFNRFDRRYEEAARDLGATSWQTIRFVVIPILLPSLIGVGLFGFTLSYDEFARSLYTSGTFNTLPLEIYGMTTNVTTPVLYALGTVTTAVSFAVIALALVSFTWGAHAALPASPPAPRQRRRQGGMSAPLSVRRRARVLRLPTASPQDTVPLANAIDCGEIDPATIIAIVGKTEGNGCVNDFTRGYATLSLKLLLAESLKCAPSKIDKRVAIVMSGGTEGGLSPHLLVFCREPATTPAAGPRLAIGVGLTRAFVAEEIGRAAQIEETASAVTTAMKDAGIVSPADVHFVQIKCPLLTKERIKEAARRGATVATEDTYHSMALSRGASALGVAVALGEVLTAAMKTNDRWQLLFAEFWLHAMRDPQVREQWVTHRRQYHEQLAALVDEILRGSSMSSKLPARSSMFVLLAASNGLAIEELADPGSTPPDLLGQVFALLTK